MRNIRKLPLIAGIIFLCLAITGFIVPRVMRTAIILQMGIMTANNLNKLYLPILLLAAITTAFAFIPKRRPVYHEKYEFTVDELDKLDPDEVRKMLMECLEKHPAYRSLYNECINQIDLIKEQQENFEKLIKLNDADYLNDAISTLRLAEQTIFRNLMTAVNRGIVEKTHGKIDTDKEIEFKNLLERVISANENVFETNQSFLIHASSAISSKKMRVQSKADTEAWIQALENLVLPSEIFEEKEQQQPFQTPG